MMFPTKQVVVVAFSFASIGEVCSFSPLSFLAPPYSASRNLSTQRFMTDSKTKVVVIGNGMVGQRFMENLIRLDEGNKCTIATFCEEKRAAYNRVKLTSYFETRNPSDLSMTDEYNEEGKTSWFNDNNVEIFLNDKAVAMDTEKKTITGESGRIIDYDVAVLATGSFRKFIIIVQLQFILKIITHTLSFSFATAFVPPIPGKQRPGVFVYRTIEDLEAMLSYAKENNVVSAAVIGGGLLGLEAAKAVKDMGIESHIIEFAPILMCRQIDQGGHDALVGKIEEMGLKVHCNARTEAFVGTDGSVDNESLAPVTAIRFSNEGWDDLPVQMVVVSAGIKPRDELARQSGIVVGERGGVVVDEQMRTTAQDVYAIGEIALYNNFIYGLIAPGYEMATVASKVIAAEKCGIQSLDDEDTPAFTGADLSTKLKLLGCDVASFGENQPKPDDEDINIMTWNDSIGGIYRKLIFNKNGTVLKGGILVGDANDYTKLHKLAIGGEQLSENPALLLTPSSARGTVTEDTDDIPSDANALICSCNDVSRGTIATAISELGIDQATLANVKKCTRAGTGCGGCEPQIKSILAEEVKKQGGSFSNNLCEHFPYSRPELVAKIRCEENLNDVDSFDKILAKFGNGDGCETCKPAVAGILASLVNDMILDNGRDSLQDTNDRSLANMQRGGTYCK